MKKVLTLYVMTIIVVLIFGSFVLRAQKAAIMITAFMFGDNERAPKIASSSEEVERNTFSVKIKR